MDGRRPASGKKSEKTLGEWAKRVTVAEAELNKCGLERRQPNIREGRPMQKVPDWVQDNDFAGVAVLPPNEDMERLDKEIRAAIAELEKGEAPTPAPQSERMNEEFVNFWNEWSKRPMPQVDPGTKPSTKQPKEAKGGGS